jgi:ATP-binding cassette subfamily B protein
MASQVTLAALVPIPFIVGLSFFLYPRIRERYEKVRDQAARLSGQVTSNLDGMATIKSFTLASQELQRIEALSAAYRNHSREAVTLAGRFSVLLEGIVLTSLAIIVLLGGGLVSAGSVTVGSYVVLLMLTGQLFYPLVNLGLPLDNLERGLTALRRVSRLLELPVEDDPGARRLSPAMVQGNIVYDAVHFTYPNGVKVFAGLSMRFAASTTTALVGSSGSGKSTLVNVLLRFFELDGGRILLDGEDIANLHRADLRQAIAVVSQDVFLFPRTVLENIAVGKPGAHLDAIVQAAQAAHAHEFITQLPQGYYTLIGERGEKLSGGQRQRLAIARALLKDAPILVLDEATSSLSVNMETAILQALRRLDRQRTLIVITHRPSAIRSADYVYVLEQGRLVEEGTHQQLLGRGGRYQELGFQSPEPLDEGDPSA